MPSVAGFENFDVIIVGAGLTGLTTAYNLLTRDVGLSILILEKNDHIGGRILRGRRSEGYFGNYAHKNITSLLEKLEIPIESAKDPDDHLRDFIFLTEEPSGSSKDDVSRLDSFQVYHFLKLLNWMTGADKKSEAENNQHSTTSVQQLMESTVTLRRARILCASLLRACCPGIEDLRQVSALWFLIMLTKCGGIFRKLSSVLSVEKRYFIKAGGFEVLAETLEKRIAESGGIVKRSEIVAKIDPVDQKIQVSSESVFKQAIHHYGCACVVVAVPPPDNSLIILDKLVGLRGECFIDSWRSYQGGQNFYFYGSYEESFWPASSVLFEGKKNRMRTIHETSRNREEGSRAIAGFSTARNVADIQAALNVYFGAHDPTSFLTSHASPVYAPRPLGLRLTTPGSFLDGRVIFAASEFAKEWRGTADGAVEAAHDATRAVLSRLRPQALEASETMDSCISPQLVLHGDSWRETEESVKMAHGICLGLNVCLLFLLLAEAWKTS